MSEGCRSASSPLRSKRADPQKFRGGPQWSLDGCWYENMHDGELT